jgi:UMF1 family MFS transporter
MDAIKTVATDRKERFSWYLYDFANTSFTVLIVTALFPLYFEELATSFIGVHAAQAFWGFAGSITMFVVAIISPVLGAIADYSGAKKKFLVAFTTLCIIFNAMLFITTMEAPPILGIPIWVWAWVFFILANIGFEGALPFYDAWLPEISDEETIGRISGYGYAAGYVGAMLTVVIALVSVIFLGTASTIPFLLSALFFLIFAIPSIWGLKNRPPTTFPEEEGANLAEVGYYRLRRTLWEIKTYQGVPLFMVAFFLFSDAISTVIYYAAVFGKTVYGFSTELTLVFFAVVQLSAIPGAFIFGYIADKIGTKKTLIITLFLWVITLIIAFLGTEQIVWWIVGMIAGVGMGSSQSTARSMYGQFIPEEKRTEMFGLLAFTGRFAAILGPFVFGLMLIWGEAMGFDIALSNRYAMLSVLLFFVIALIILFKVKQPVKGMSKTRSAGNVLSDLDESSTLR